MTAAEIEFLMQRIREEYGAGALEAGTGAAGEEPPLTLVDRNNARDEADQRGVTEDLQDTNVVSIASVDEATTPIGTEYDHDIEHVAGVRIEGLHESEWGHIDPDADAGAAWDSLSRFVRRAILRARTFPKAKRPNVDYTDLRLSNHAPQSQDYADYYRYDVDVIFDGFEELP